MYHDHTRNFLQPEEFAALGKDAVTYFRQISAEEIKKAFPDAAELESKREYWVLFAANGEPLMVTDQEVDVISSAFYNDLEAIKPN